MRDALGLGYLPEGAWNGHLRSAVIGPDSSREGMPSVTVLVPRHVVLLVAHITGWPPFIIGSVYLHNSEGLTFRNSVILGRLGYELARRRMPFLLCGDWNMSPAILAASTWLEAMSAQIVATGKPTFHGHTSDTDLDYFVASRCLLHGYGSVASTKMDTRNTNIGYAAPTFEHSIVTCRFKKQAAALKIPVIARFQRYPLEMGKGPNPKVRMKHWLPAHEATDRAVHAAKHYHSAPAIKRCLQTRIGAKLHQRTNAEINKRNAERTPSGSAGARSQTDFEISRP